MRTIKRYLSVHHQKVTNIVSIFSYLVGIPATIIGIWFTYYSISSSAKVVESQLKEQKKATSVIIVSDFLTEIGNRYEDMAKGDERKKNLIITRSNLLVETLGFPDLTSQVVRFLGVNDFGDLFDASRGMDDKKFIDLANVNLTNGQLGDVVLKRPNFYCSDLKGALIDNAQITDGNFYLANLYNTRWSSTKLLDSTLQWVNLENAYIPNIDLDGTVILFSNLEGVHVYDDENLTQGEKLNKVAETLSTAKSLYGTKLDHEIKTRLEGMGKSELLTRLPIPVGSDDESIKDRIKKIYIKNEKVARENWEEEWVKKRGDLCKLAF